MEVRIPKSVQAIEENAFYGCGELEKIIIARDSKLAEIKSGAFHSCSKLKLVIVPRNIKTVAKTAFSKNVKVVRSLSIPTVMSKEFAE